MAFKLLLLLVFFSLSFAKVYVARWEGPITPPTYDYIDRVLGLSEREKASTFILILNTPGGLLETTRKIVSRFLQSKVDTVVFIYPSGSRAGSAGAIISISAKYCVMAPGTNIGSAHPVSLFGKENKILREKVLNDTLALVRSVAKLRHRNSKVVEAMVKRSISLTEREALKKGVIDFIAKDLKELLRKLNREGEEVVLVEPNSKEKLLKFITNPTVAYLLFLLGLYGLIYELLNPGALLPGTVGLISLVLALYGMNLISTDYLPILLMAVGVFFLVLEAITPTFGGLALAGALSLLLGTYLYLPYFVENRWQLLLTSLLFSLALFALVLFSLKAQRKEKRMLGKEELIGKVAQVVEDFKGGEGYVMINGELWKGVSEEDLKKGDKALVERVENLKVYLKKL